MQATIKHVKDIPRPWESQNGPVHSVEGSFEDGSDFSVTCKPENSAARIAEFKALIGQAGEFELRPKKDYQGRKQWSVVSWPGKPERPAFTGGGAGGGQRAPYQVRFRDTEEGFAREQRSIHRSVALQWAVTWLPRVGDITSGDVLDVAAVFYGWLSQDAPDFGPQKGPASVGQIEAQQKQAARDLGLPVESKHPSLDELKSRFGMQTADQLKTARDKYIEAIHECVKTKNHERLKKLPELIVQSCEANTLSMDEADELERHLTAAKKALSSAAEYDRWHAERLTEAQDRMPKSF